MEIVNLGAADDLPPVDWSAIVGKIDSGSAPERDAVNSRTTWLSTVNETARSGSRRARARGSAATSHAIPVVPWPFPSLALTSWSKARPRV